MEVIFRQNSYEDYIEINLDKGEIENLLKGRFSHNKVDLSPLRCNKVECKGKIVVSVRMNIIPKVHKKKLKTIWNYLEK